MCNSISFVHLVIKVNRYSSITIPLPWAKTIPAFYHPSASSDYSSRRGSVYFRAGVNEVSFTVPIRDEGQAELNEEFYIDLEIPSSTANLGAIKDDSPSTATVTILDDDGECSSSALCTTMNTN